MYENIQYVATVIFFFKEFYLDFPSILFDFIRENTEEEREKRWNTIQQQIESQGTYDLDEKELVFGARLAWRNAARCIGRIQWKKLQVSDRDK